MNMLRKAQQRQDPVGFIAMLALLFGMLVCLSLAFALIFVLAFVHYHHGWSDAGVQSALYTAFC
jgi:hypothetical protein